MSENAPQEAVPAVLPSATPQMKKTNAEVGTRIGSGFLKRIGHKSTLKQKQVSLAENIYTIEVKLKS